MPHFIILALTHSVFFLSFLVEFAPGTGFGLTIISLIKFPINLPVASAALWTTFLEEVLKASSPQNLFDKNDKNAYSLTYFLFLVSIE